MRSVQRTAECMGFEGDIDVVRDFFGYATGVPRETSLSRQMRLMHRFHVGINVILVGVESFGEAEHEEIDEAVAIMRDAYAAVEFGVAPVLWFHQHGRCERPGAHCQRQRSSGSDAASGRSTTPPSMFSSC